MYFLISSTKFDPYLLTLGWNRDESESKSPFFLLNYHLDRLRDAALKHNWTQHAVSALSPRSVLASCHQAVPNTANAFKIRLSLSQSGELNAIATPTQSFTEDPTSASFFKPDTDDPFLYGPIVTVYLDTQPTPTSLFTSTKTTIRDAYVDARLRAGISPPDVSPHSEVLLYNTQNLITDASIFNVAFYHSPCWLTPPASSGCLSGVMRRWLLEQGRIREAESNILTKDVVKDGDWVLLFNGVQGCRIGRVSLSDGMLWQGQPHPECRS